MKQYFFLCMLLFSLAGFSQNKLVVYFDFNKDVPNEASQIRVDQWLLENKNVEVTKLLGYCDSVDNNKYNKDLALRRINSMLSIFNKSSIKISDKVEMKSFGEDFKYSKIQSENRKVEVFYKIPKVEKPVAIAEKIANVKPKEKKSEAADVSEFEAVNVDSLVADEKSKLAVKFEKAKKGDLVRISNITFYLNSEKVTEHSVPLLNELLQIMLDNPKMRIEIHGHICCNPNPMDTKLSYRRALVILKYLTNRGIEVGRLNYKGFGSNDPIYRVPERNEKERAANRRVEILIVDK